MTTSSLLLFSDVLCNLFSFIMFTFLFPVVCLGMLFSHAIQRKIHFNLKNLVNVILPIQPLIEITTLSRLYCRLYQFLALTVVFFLFGYT